MIIPKGCRITLDEYMGALKDMVESGDDPCFRCPGSEALINKGLKGCADRIEILECVLCRTLVGCLADCTGPPEISCPCYILEEGQALERAIMEVDAWEKSKSDQ